MTEIPLKAESFITMGTTHLLQKILFYYYDPELIYFKINQDLEDTGYNEEYEKIFDNMQAFLDEDRIFINEYEIFLNLQDVDISFPSHEDIYPVLVFQAKSTSFTIKKGENIVRLEGQRVFSPYYIEIHWNLPGKVLKMETSNTYEIIDNILVLKVQKGEPIGGPEKIHFEY